MDRERITGQQETNSGPEVRFEDVSVDVPEARFWTATRWLPDNFCIAVRIPKEARFCIARASNPNANLNKPLRPGILCSFLFFLG